MADTKITALTALTAADPINDVIPIVDVSDTSMAASGTTKKISVNNILSSSPTASGALTVTGLVTAGSATITGALTAQGTQVKLANQAAADCTVLIGPDSPSATRSGRIGFITSSTQKNWFIANNWNVSGGFEITQSTAAGGATMATTPSFRINSDSTFTFLNGAGGTRMSVNSTNNLVLAGGDVASNGVGITFPITQMASSYAKCLDDYEEGTWVGTLKGAVSDPTIAVAPTGEYTKIGNQVFARILFSNIITTGASGAISVTGLPFANGSNRTIGSTLCDLIATFTGSPICWVGGTATTLNFQASNSNSAASDLTHNAGTGRYFYVTIVYTV